MLENPSAIRIEMADPEVGDVAEQLEQWLSERLSALGVADVETFAGTWSLLFLFFFFFFSFCVAG